MTAKHLIKTIIYIATVSTVSTIATTNTKSQISANNKFSDTPGRQILLSQQSSEAETEIRQLIQQWFEAWSPGAETFDANQLQPLYAQGKNAILVYDDIGEEVAVIRSWNKYAQTWQPFMKQFAYWSIQPEGNIEVAIGEDMAVSNFVYVGEARYQDGREITPKQYATFVWEKQNGKWVIIREHLTSAAN